MNDYERIELAARRVAQSDCAAEVRVAFQQFADHLLALKRADAKAQYDDDEIPF